LDSCQFRTVLVASVPRVECPEHGTVTVRVPWAEKHGRFTALFERLAIDVLRECSIKGACKWLGLSWDEADGIKQRAVARGLSRKKAEPLPRLCVDEKSFGRGQSYVTIVTRAGAGDSATVEYVGDGRGQATLDAFWQGLSPEQIAGVEAVGMDMWDPYMRSTLAHVPEAARKIVHDPFHLARYLNDALNQVRLGEHRMLAASGDLRLVGTKNLWLYGAENLPERWNERLAALRGQRLKTSRAWAIKEYFRDLWQCQSLEQATALFDSWYAWAIRCRLAPIKRVARMFMRHKQRILQYFVHRLSNATAEGINNKIQSLVKKAYGYRTRERFKTDILFHCGGLDLYPFYRPC
jgi:transposase